MSASNTGSDKRVVIIGAGPAGLAVGHEVSREGRKVTVLDRNPFVGGLCNTIQHNGYKFDLGGHRWFTQNEDLNEWFRRLMGDEIVMVNRISRIYYDGKYFNYPIRFGDIFRNTGPFTIIHAGITFVTAALHNVISNEPIVNMKQAYTSQFGSKLYEMFFRCYTEKVWGRPCDQLSSDWVSQRSKGLSIWSVLQEALLGNKKDVKSLIELFMYPRDGYVRIPQRMAEDIQAQGNEVLLDSGVQRIVYHGPNDFEVFYGARDQQEPHSVRAHDLVSTVPLGLLAFMLEPQCSDAVREAANGLEFRDLVTVTLMFNRERVSDDTWLYVQDEDIIFGRIHEPKNWSPALVPDPGCTSLVLECFCTVGDHIWEMDDEAIVKQCVTDLVEKLKFASYDELTDHKIVRTRFAYPVYDLEYAGKTAIIKEFLDGFEGLHIVGRGGTFRYNNADHSIEMGLLLGRKLLGYDVDYMDVNTEQEYQEIRHSDQPRRDHYVVDAPSAEAGGESAQESGNG